MKSNFTQALFILTVAALGFASCKKAAVAPVAPAPKLNTDSVGRKIALNLVQTLTGINGGVNLNDGIKVPSQIAPGGKGPVVYSIGPGCGAVVDSTYKFSTIVHDQATTYSGSMHFVYTCSTDHLDGYIVDDTATVHSSGTNKSFTDGNSQHFVVKATDNTYQAASVKGSSWSTSLNGDTYLGVFKTIGLSTHYIYSSVVVIRGTTPSLFGRVDYVTIGKNPVSGVNYRMTGDIIFLANGKATVNIDYDNDPNNDGNFVPSGLGGAIFTLDLATGVFTQTGTYKNYDR